MSKKNIFAKFQDYVNKPKRNVFDLSFGNNLTTKFGQLTPVFCKECVPGDSFKIHSRFALQFMPMKFPVQTPMKAYLHFFYVRNRTLYKDWMDFIGGTKDNLTLPYVQPVDKKKFYRIGGLADYLGVPNVYYGEYGSKIEIELSNPNGDLSLKDAYVTEDTSIKVAYFSTEGYLSKTFFPYRSLDTVDVTLGEVDYDSISVPTGTPLASVLSSQTDEPTSDNPSTDVLACQCYCQFTANYNSELSVFVNNVYPTALLTPQKFVVLVFDSNDEFYSYNVTDEITPTFEYVVNNNNNVFKPRYEIGIQQNWLPDSGEYRVLICGYTDRVVFGNGYYYSAFQAASTAYTGEEPYFMLSSIGGAGFGSFELKDFETTPYDSDIHLNALPFRAYEAIYNSYYRNAQNNPFILDGVAEYNKYIPTYDGGADTYQYDLHQRNWEYDFLTSAVQTPQQGDIAPLVGISVTGEATFQDEDGNTYYASAQYDSDGNITGWTSHSPNMPQGSLRLLMDMAGTGISINDLRNVNSFQKFLENNIRRGLKYRDQIKSHFGVDVRYDELDMPEFIGGCSTDVNINKLSQTSESGDTPLGSFVGQASAYGESKHDITHYCDEHGFIIGILSVVPIPVYSQLLPKFFLKSEQLDYYFPEFGHIGYQPILQKEVSPLQTFVAGDDLNSVFGYNRAWYDYLDSTDEVHAQFRTTMRDFIMNRTFDTAPQLGEDFLLVDPDQLNDVFLAGTDDDIYSAEADKIIGSMYFNVSKKSPIPLFGIPRLD